MTTIMLGVINFEYKSNNTVMINCITTSFVSLFCIRIFIIKFYFILFGISISAIMLKFNLIPSLLSSIFEYKAKHIRWKTYIFITIPDLYIFQVIDLGKMGINEPLRSLSVCILSKCNFDLAKYGRFFSAAE